MPQADFLTDSFFDLLVEILVNSLPPHRVSGLDIHMYVEEECSENRNWDFEKPLLMLSTNCSWLVCH